MERKFSVSSKNAGRSAGWRATLGLGVLVAVNLTALARAGQLAAIGQGSMLVLCSTVVVAVNTALLTHLLVSVIRYERRRARPAYAGLAPESLYRYLLVRRGGLPVASTGTRLYR